MKPKKYRQKTPIVAAMHLPENATPAQAMAVYQWVEENTLGSFEPLACIDGEKPWPESGVSIDPRDGRIIIVGSHFPQWVDLGDYIVRNGEGSFTPCPPGYFERLHFKRLHKEAGE